MEENKVCCEVVEHVGWITMQCGKNRNAIDEGMADVLLQALSDFEDDVSVRVIVLSSADKAFSSGGDVRFFYSQLEGTGTIDLSALLEKVGKLSLTLRRSKKLIIAAVNGVAAGAGASLALSCDFVICSQSASFIQAFTKVGLVPDAGAGYFLPRTIGIQRAMEYCALAKPMLAEDAKNFGLVNQVVPDSELNQSVQELATKLAAGPLTAYANLKRQMYDACFADYDRYLAETETVTQLTCAKTLDAGEGVRAFIEKRKPVFTGK